MESTSHDTKKPNILSIEDQLLEVDNLSNQEEKSQAYVKLVKQIDELLRLERFDNEKNLRENSNFIQDQCTEIEELKKEIETAKEQTSNNKALLEESNLQIENLKKILATSGHQACTEQIHALEERVIDLQDFINTLEEANLEAESRAEQNIDQSENLDNQSNHSVIVEQNEENMEITAKDVITAIPFFSGDIKQLDGFINTCELYHGLVPANHQETVLKIIKAKIIGDAANKIGPFEDELNTWPLIKERNKGKMQASFTGFCPRRLKPGLSKERRNH